MGQYIWEDIVQRQRDWYGKWVEEMARIAKPGVPVIVEQVSAPYCDYQVRIQVVQVVERRDTIR